MIDHHLVKLSILRGHGGVQVLGMSVDFYNMQAAGTVWGIFRVEIIPKWLLSSSTVNKEKHLTCLCSGALIAFHVARAMRLQCR